MTAQPTERDRVTAAGLLPDAIRLYYPDVLDAIAQALADEREAALRRCGCPKCLENQT